MHSVKSPDAGPGFTLIELLITVMVVGIIAMLVGPKFTSSRQRAARSAAVADLRRLATGEERFFAEHQRYGEASELPVRDVTPSAGRAAAVISLTGSPPGASGYSARVAISGGEVCGLFIGTAPRPAGMPTGVMDGVPACWSRRATGVTPWTAVSGR